MHLISVIFAVAWIMLAGLGAAHADPITTALFGAAFAASTFGAVVTYAITAVVGIAINYGLSLLQKADESKQAPQGFQLEAKVGDAVPLSFPVGYCATAGTRKYIGSWGNDGETPNAYLTDCYQLSDMVGAGLNGFWADKVKRTVLWGEATELGAPIAEYRVGGKDHMWVRYRSGAETTADALMVGKFGSSARPWTSNMIGRGCEQAIVTVLVNRDLFDSQPTFLFEPAPRAWYDLRKDSTNGGSGAHRWDDQSTWQPSQNPAVIIYNIVRGIYYGSEWVYGGQNLPAFRLPASSWMAAANECDVAIPLAAGGTEPQFRCGAEIRGDIEPLAQIQELLVACNGRMAEVGGSFEILVGAPGAAVFSFTDDDIRITTSQGYAPFPGLDSTHNGIEATYPEPVEMWATKDAPARYSSELETEDGERRLITGVNYGSVPFGTQVQRLMKSGIEEERRFRVHEHALGPESWALTPNAVLSWTSARNGYVNKKFLLVRKSGEPGMFQKVTLKEIDPSDYSWSSADELPSATGPLVTIRPEPQEVSGFYVEPAIVYDADANARRPAIDAFWASVSVTVDVRAVRVSVRLASDDTLVWEGEAPRPELGSARLTEGLLPNQAYEVQIQYVPFSGRVTVESSWLSVTTPDIRLGPLDVIYGDIDLDELGEQIGGLLEWMGSNVRDLIEQAQAQAVLTGDQELANASQFDEMRRSMSTVVGDLSASFDETITTAIIPMNGKLVAMADALTQLTAADGDDVSTARIRFSTMTGPTGYSRIGIETRFDTADPADYRLAGSYWDTPNDPMQPTRRIEIADQFIIANSLADITFQPFVFEGGEAKMMAARVGTITSGRLQSFDGKFLIDLDNKRISIST